MSLTNRFLNLNDSSPAAPSGEQNVKWQIGATSGNEPTTGYPIFPVSAYLPLLIGDSGSGGVSGAVPAPAAGDAAAGKVLKADGTWATFSSFSPLAALTALTVNAPATVLVNSAAVSYDDTILINGTNDVALANGA